MDDLKSLGLADHGFSTNIPGIKPRLILNIEGEEKMGKTTFALTSPDPIVYMNFDRSTEGPLNRAAKNKKVAYKEYFYAQKITEDIEKTVEAVRPIWKAFEDDYRFALKSRARSIIVDTGVSAWELRRLARFGKLQQVPPLLYTVVNAQFSRLITMAQDYDKNVLWLHRLYPEWKEQTDSQGRTSQKKTGKLERRGYKDMSFDVQANIRVSRPDGTFQAEVIDSRLNGETAGMIFSAEDCNFPSVAAAIFENSPKDWK